MQKTLDSFGVGLCRKTDGEPPKLTPQSPPLLQANINGGHSRERQTCQKIILVVEYLKTIYNAPKVPLQFYSKKNYASS